MTGRSIGFIGGGRVTRILLAGLTRAGKSPESCVVSDADPAVLESLKGQFPGVTTAGDDPHAPASQRLVFGALHPPQLKETLPRIAGSLAPETLFVSLAPVIRIPALQQALGGFRRVARMIPNAASLVGAGFNPIAFAPELDPGDADDLLTCLCALGSCPEVPDDQLEAYAILTAMGPTYFWHQFETLQQLATELGLDEMTARQALSQMLYGSVETFFESGLAPEEVIDLVPVKPLAPVEADLRECYRTRLRALHAKLSGQPRRAVDEERASVG